MPIASASASRALPSLLSTRQIRSAPKSLSRARNAAPCRACADKSSPPNSPISSAPNQTTRIVRSGRPASMIRLAAAAAMATPARIVDRAGAEVPAVEVAADQDRRRLGIAARHFGDDIARLAGADVSRRDQQSVHRHRLAALQDALELLGVGDR